MAIGWDDDSLSLTRTHDGLARLHRKTGKARLFLRYARRQYNRTINVGSEREAERACALIEETIQDLQRGKLAMPPGADPVDFLLSGGRVTVRPERDPDPSAEAKGPRR
ncbi:MAG: hypothetical protein JWN86_471 [Planctomycetota bacterium]|nr:hypothetical protein [Planctomycetota bacterium]